MMLFIEQIRRLILDISMDYVQEIKKLPSLIKEIVAKFHESTPKRLKLVDYFIVFLAVLTFLQLVYYALIGRHPFEALLAGVYTTLGTMIFTGMHIHIIIIVALRMHITYTIQVGGESAEFDVKFSKSALAEYMIACLVLYLTALNYMR